MLCLQRREAVEHHRHETLCGPPSQCCPGGYTTSAALQISSSVATDSPYDQVAFSPGETGQELLPSGVFELQGAVQEVPVGGHSVTAPISRPVTTRQGLRKDRPRPAHATRRSVAVEGTRDPLIGPFASDALKRNLWACATYR